MNFFIIFLIRTNIKDEELLVCVDNFHNIDESDI